MTDSILIPAMRLQIFSAVESLSRPDLQKIWIEGVPPGVQYYDDLDLVVHVLYDDCEVLPNPESAVPSFIYHDETDVFAALEENLGPMISELRDSPDEVYLNDRRWPGVLRAANRVYEAMKESDRVHGTR